MKRTVTIVVTLLAAAGFVTTAVAQGRHDEKPHGFSARVATEQMAGSSATTYVALPSGPRAHDNPLRGKKIAIAQPKSGKAAVTASNLQN
jgi:hypothetical protein